MKSVKTINFEANITMETSMQSTLTDLGRAKCSMELFTESGEIEQNGSAMVEWIVEYLDEAGELTDDDDVEHIGLWFENKTLTDYDGVFSLPKEAIELIRLVGIIVPADFEESAEETTDDVQEVAA